MSGERNIGVDVVGRHQKLVGRTALISVLTAASRVIGFARESLSASMFGDRSAVNDAFVTAWRIPNLFRSLLGEGAISTSLQTALTKTDAERGEEAGRQLFLTVLRTVWWMLFALCAFGMLVVHFMPDRMPVTGAQWLGDEPAIVRELVVRMLPFVIFVCLSAVCSGALSVRGHFASPSLAPVLMNVWWIAALFIVARQFGWSRPAGSTDAAEFARQMEMARWLATFVLIAGSILLLVQIPALVTNGLLFRQQGSKSQSTASAGDVWIILKASAPLAIGAGVYQINVMIDGLMAEALLANGGPSLLYYATRLQQLPLSLVSIAATSAVFPALTALGHTREHARLKKLHDDTHHAIAFVAVPATFGLFALAAPVVAVCFEHGAFGPEGVHRAAAALRWLTLAILPAGAAGLVARAYYALGDFKTPVKVAVSMLCLNTALNVLFVAGFGMDADGLALATALTSWGNLFFLLPGLRTRFGLPRAEPGTVLRLVKITAAALVAALAALGTYSALAPERASALILMTAIGVSVATYATLVHVLGVPEWRHVLARLGR
jgi:putative peptidoglycan lipid II flippase